MRECAWNSLEAISGDAGSFPKVTEGWSSGAPDTTEFTHAPEIPHR